MLKITHPNPKSCSKCCKMLKSNFSFLGVTFIVGGMLKCPTLTLKIVPNAAKCLKTVPNVAKCLNPTFIFGCDVHGWGMLKWPTLTLKVVPNVAKCLDPTFHFGCDMLGWGYAENSPPQPENSNFQMSI